MKFNSESEQVQEVFAHFGEAFYQAQCLEKQTAILLSCLYAPNPNEMSKMRSDELFDMNLEQTFGALKKEIKSRIDLPTDVDTKLERAIESRNWLAHHYWWDRASEFTSFSGRQKMLAELDELTTLFSELDQVFADMVKKWGFHHGLTKEDFDASLAELLSGPTPPRKKRRKLSKTETLINVYSYTTESGTTLLFELDDNSFWSLCDCGLTYGPEDIDSSQLCLLPQFQKALPAIIMPRPKRAKDWRYKIHFSSGYRFEVLPSEKGEKLAFRWKFHSRSIN